MAAKYLGVDRIIYIPGITSFEQLFRLACLYKEEFRELTPTFKIEEELEEEDTFPE